MSLLVALLCRHVHVIAPPQANAGGKKQKAGNIDEYEHIYEINIEDHASMITFRNHAVSVNGCSQTQKTYKVRAVKGDSNSDWQSRDALAESLGITWSDSYPTGYGFSAQWRKCANGWGDGPFFPSVQHGSGRGCSCCQNVKYFESAEKQSDPMYISSPPPPLSLSRF
jgi:hypothetical protein